MDYRYQTKDEATISLSRNLKELTELRTKVGE